jgi:hypothetical protein
MTFCSDIIYVQEEVGGDKTAESKRFLLSLSLYSSTWTYINPKAIAFYPCTSYIVQSFAPKVNPVNQLRGTPSLYKRKIERDNPPIIYVQGEI